MKIRVLSHKDTETLLDMRSVIAMVEEAYRQKEAGEATLFPMVFHEFDPGKADMDIKSGHLKGAGVFGLKLVSWFGGNPVQGLPALFGTVALFAGNTGAPLGILSAEHVTCMRTGAAGAIGAKYLARKNAKTLLMVGAGTQSTFQIAATLMAVSGIEKVYIHDPLNRQAAVDLAGSISERMKNEFAVKYQGDSSYYKELTGRYSVEFASTGDLQQAVGEADIIITATPSRQALINNAWVRPGTHFSCVGADMSGKQEIDEEILRNARVFVDDREQSVSVGECEAAYKKGYLDKNILPEIGSLLQGRVAGRQTEEEVTVFDSTGIALQDIICAQGALEAAAAANIGTEAEL